MSTRPTTWEPLSLGLLCVLAFAIGAWMAVHGYEQQLVVACFTVGGLVQLSESHRQSLVEDFRFALRDTDLGIRKAALHMSIDPSDLERMLGGLQRFDVWRIEMLPEETRRCFYFRRAQRLGLPTYIRHAVKMIPAFDAERSV